MAKRAVDCDILMVNATINFDHETAVSLADRFCEREYFFFLESATSGPGSIARYSFIGFDALLRFESDGTNHLLWSQRGSAQKITATNPLRALERSMRGLRARQVQDGVPYFQEPELSSLLGMCGYLSYELIHYIEPSVPLARQRALDIPIAHFFIPEKFLVIDHLRHRVTVCRVMDLRRGEGSSDFGAVHAELSSLIDEVMTPHELPPLEMTQDQPTVATQIFDQKMFEQAAGQAAAEIAAGEIFQIQIGNRISAKTGARAMDVFRHLRILNPSPYMFFYKLGEHHILGASPEMMVQVEGRRIVHRPIAGTRKRKWNAEKDRQMVEELQTSEKERAEHVMLVDLARNDIGRIAAPGSVRVEELMNVETYSHVFHLVSQVTGELADGKNCFDAMEASFPNGTVCGAPKIRAMQLISQYEELQRQFYAGSLGVFTLNGDLKSTILIRTIYMRQGVVSTQASAGIVFDSRADQEWLEVKNKTAACLTAMSQTAAVR